jgi:hypothetical protein
MKDYRMSVFNISLIILYLLLYAFVECGICVRMWFCDFILPCVEVGSLLAENQQQARAFFSFVKLRLQILLWLQSFEKSKPAGKWLTGEKRLIWRV